MEQNNLEKIRHSLSHILAGAVLSFYPDAKLAIGPAIDNGFYYDFEFNSPISDKDLGKIEQKMRDLLKKWDKFKKKEISLKEAEKMFKGNPYKLELIADLKKEKNEPTIYISGDFTDLCAGPHVTSTKEIPKDAFKLDRLAGAYWCGNEKNKMLTRIYGLAFETKNDLENYIKQQEEAQKRDHRKLGKELDLFLFSDLVGKGLPLYTEKGATIRRELEKLVVEEEIKRGYKHVCTPDLAKVDLYKKSGHFPYYKDTMYPVMKIDEEELILRPMTCPHHYELYLAKPHSYKELPYRIAELAKQFRYEKSGELTGLIRVRCFCLADSHIMCQPEKVDEEINRVLDLIDYMAKILGLKLNTDYRYRLSLGDRKDEKKYYKDDKAWGYAENVLRKVLKDRNAPFFEAENEAAFYGPKIDIQMKNFAGKEDTAFTVQYDFVGPKRFNLVYTDNQGKEKEAVVIHRSSIGCIERTMAFLIEKYIGNFPLWLSPVQVKIIPVRDNHNDYAKKIADELKAINVRVEFADNDEGMGKKIRAGKINKIPYMLVIGDKEIESGELALEIRDTGTQEKITLEKLKAKLQKEISERL